jgi:hypothetical protein
MNSKPKKLRPGPKKNEKHRHRLAATYFCLVATEEGWTLSRISQLCEALYGVKVSPHQIAAWADYHRRQTKKLKDEFRTIPDVVR